ncbi:oxidoreductase [Robbsia sp. Bb-Pol-6]|uniref:Oxidoreductase n=1 Tax=Robbsia betulipollinis TaxID=2981849 RepID=A0ABT3ZHL5_9BURK|nr:oxidoreductase [Robbsia betulipollinis]MCY0385912.1 oxidoreductase [Robbsia betulipollinis]
MTHDDGTAGAARADEARTAARDGIRVGLIGYGSASKTFHAPLIGTTPGLRLVAVSSRDAAKVHADLPDVAVEATPEALLARADIDLVIIPTPNATHFPLALAALRQGRHVVVDKPFTLTLAEAEQLAAVAAERRLLLTVFHNRRWDADFLAVRQLVRSGELGRISVFESAFPYFRPEPRDRWRERAGEGGGLWNDLGPHLVDQALQLFGMPQAIYLDAQPLREGAQTDDYFTAILRYADKRAILRVNASAGLPTPRFIVQGTLASYSKFGTDGQEDALRAGQRPGQPGSGWGHDPIVGALRRHADGKTLPYPSPSGDYPAFYASVRDALQPRYADREANREAGRDADAMPVAAVDLPSALAVVALLDAGRASLAARVEQPCHAPG